MNLLRIVLVSLRERALTTVLTMIALALSVALAVAILILRREGAALFGQTEYGYDVVVGAKGSPLQLVLNSVYHLDQSPGNIPYRVYEDLLRDPSYRPMVKTAVPYAVGDSYRGHRVIGTLPRLFGFADDGQTLAEGKVHEYRPGRRHALSSGRVFHAEKFEAVIGAAVPAASGLAIGSRFAVSHGVSPSAQQEHAAHHEEWTVVGIMAATATADDRAIFIPLTSFFAIDEHRDGLRAQAAIAKGEAPPAPAAEEPGHEHHHHHHHDEAAGDGLIHGHLPKEEWQVSSILVRTRSTFHASNLIYQLNHRGQTTAVNPATVMRDFFAAFLAPIATVLRAISYLATFIAAIGIVVGTYNAVAARGREIAILRALGATRRRILVLVCAETGTIGVVGGCAGVVLGHLLAAAASMHLTGVLGEGIAWTHVSRDELVYLAGVIVATLIAGLVPAIKAYRTPVASNLVST